MPRMLKCAALLASLALLSGCNPPFAVIVTEKLCDDWRHQTVSRRDKITDETASGIEASNNSRPNWGCKYGEPTYEGKSS